MRIRGFYWTARALRPIVQRFRPGALILLYHRVAELESDPQWLSVPPGLFAEQMDLLHRTCHPMHLTEVSRRLNEGSLPRRAVAVTFDDGYADNLYQAKPILERQDVPATVFVTAGRIGTTQEFWWDALDRLLLAKHPLPRALKLQIAGRLLSLDLGAEVGFGNGTRWNVAQRTNPTARHAAYRELASALHTLDDEAREQVLLELHKWAGQDDAQGRSTHRTLSAEEVTALAEGGLVDIGSHTVNHPLLARRSIEQQHQEVFESKAILERILGRPVLNFSYPFGGPNDYTSATVALVRKAGYAIACANREGIVWRWTDRWTYPRVLVRDWSAERLERLLYEWLP